MEKCKKLLQNKKLLAVLGMLTVILVTLAVATYTWFFNGGTLLNIEFESGYIQMETYLYEGKDFDRDGILDTDTAENSYSPVYELISADEVQNQRNPIVISGVPELDNETLKLPDITMEKFYPGQVYTYKMEMENEGDVESYIQLSFNSLQNDSGLSGIKDVISVEVFAEGTENMTAEEMAAHPEYEQLFQGKHMLCAWQQPEPLILASGVPFIDSGEPDEQGNAIYTATLIIKVRFEPKETLDSILHAQGMSLETYNDYCGKEFSIPDMTLRLYTMD